MTEPKMATEKTGQSTYRLNLLDAKAENSIRRHQIKGFINAGSGCSDIKINENDENSQLSEHLLHLKTSCSGVKVDIKNKELQQLKFKDETQFMNQKIKVIQAERYQLETEIQKLKKVVEEVKNKKMNATLSSKSYEHVLERMKKDQIKYQIRRNDLEKELRGLEKAYKELHDRGYELKQYEFMSASGLKEAQGQIKELNHNRKATLADMNSIVEEKVVLQKKKQERKEKSDMIKEMAAGDLQDADLIRMKKFLTTQVFLQAVLKRKIEKLKSFYEPYELAFLKVKGKTNVRDASSLKAEYHNFETSYSQKSSWVKHLEDEISRGEEEKQQLERQYAIVKEKELEIQQELEKVEGDFSNPYRKQLQLKSETSEIMMMAMKEWLHHQSVRMGIDSSNRSEVEVLREICQRLKQNKRESVGTESR